MKAFDPQNHRNTHETTIAQFNRVSVKGSKKPINSSAPFRVLLPDFFNIPSFEDQPLVLPHKPAKVPLSIKENGPLKKRIKDLNLLAEGMKRAKNVKEESRFYFTLGVLLHNNQDFHHSIEYFEKFLRLVITMGDQKSVELGLNAIGCEYMHLGEFERAIEFHNKQMVASANPDRFLGFANIGLCNELLENHQEAYINYTLLRGELNSMSEDDPDFPQREKLFQKLVSRAENKVLENEVFMTEKPESHSKALKSSFLKEESSILMKKVQNRKEYESAKLNFAISAAEENIDDYLKSTFQT